MNRTAFNTTPCRCCGRRIVRRSVKPQFCSRRCRNTADKSRRDSAHRPRRLGDHLGSIATTTPGRKSRG